MNYNRLIAFGCSYTYGHGLPDCLRNDNSPGPCPSKFAWPELLGNKLGAETHNLGRPGNSNKNIWKAVVDFQYQPGDIAVVCWSFLSRWCVLSNDGPTNPIGNWVEETSSKAFYKHLYSDYDMNVDANLRINHADTIFKQHNITAYHSIFDPEYIKEGWNKTQYTDFNIGDISQRLQSYAPDGHPGAEAHKEFAEKLYKHITGN